MNNKTQIKETIFKAKDVRLLRERLVWAAKKSPPQIQTVIHQTLLAFAKSVSVYCLCEEKVYIVAENKDACLNCGTRHENNMKPLTIV